MAQRLQPHSGMTPMLRRIRHAPFFPFVPLVPLAIGTTIVVLQALLFARVRSLARTVDLLVARRAPVS
jgi:hypothetical protein